MLPQYNQWFDMLQRCTSVRIKSKKPNYLKCTAQPGWVNYDTWLLWANKQRGFNQIDLDGKLFQLDKDLLGSGNYYGEVSCCFLPKEINQMLLITFNGFAVLPNGSYRVVGSIKGKGVHIACVATLEEGIKLLASHKTSLIKQAVDKYTDFLDDSIKHALVNYDFESKLRNRLNVRSN